MVPSRRRPSHDITQLHDFPRTMTLAKDKTHKGIAEPGDLVRPYSTILESIVGSTLHGTSVADGLEDLDLMAIVVERKERLIGFDTTDTWTLRTKPDGVRSEAGDVDWVGYGLKKYLKLALAGNPSILLPLFAPNIDLKAVTRTGCDLRKLSPSIISKKVYQPFKGYLRQQYSKATGAYGAKKQTRPELIKAHGYDTKFASHAVRLGFQGHELLMTGKITLPMPVNQRKVCVDVRSGLWSFKEVCDLVLALEADLDDALLRSPLPEEPNTKLVENWMINTYLRFFN
jgi:hypothetical protein